MCLTRLSNEIILANSHETLESWGGIAAWRRKRLNRPVREMTSVSASGPRVGCKSIDDIIISFCFMSDQELGPGLSFHWSYWSLLSFHTQEILYRLSIYPLLRLMKFLELKQYTFLGQSAASSKRHSIYYVILFSTHRMSSDETWYFISRLFVILFT